MVKIRGTQATLVEIQVSEHTIFEEAARLLRSKHDVRPGAYINKEGEMEVWFNTHGSGDYEQYGKPTDIQKRAIEAAMFLEWQ